VFFGVEKTASIKKQFLPRNHSSRILLFHQPLNHKFEDVFAGNEVDAVFTTQFGGGELFPPNPATDSTGVFFKNFSRFFNGENILDFCLRHASIIPEIGLRSESQRVIFRFLQKNLTAVFIQLFLWIKFRKYFVIP